MITIYTPTGAVPLRVDDYYIKELASGLDELIFTISIWDEMYKYIQEEASLREESEAPILYTIKAIDGGTDTAQIKAQIDLDDWKAGMTIAYTSGSATVGEIVSAVAPSGWTVNDLSGFTYRRTINLDAATPLDVLDQCRSTFSGITFRWDNVAKTVTIINELGGRNLGAFATRELNLSGCQYKGKSTDFATRLYAYGKDGLSFASINDGKSYVENHTYSNRVISAYWKDERYTVAESLLQDAQAKLDTMAVPQRSFDCEIVDLAAVEPIRFGHLAFPLFSIIGLIDETRSSAKIDHRVVGRWRYPNSPDKNKVILSTVAPRIQAQITQVSNNINNANSEWNQKQQAALDGMADAILGANAGSVRLIDSDGDGAPDTLYIANNVSPASATTVWRFNASGWAVSSNGYAGPFVTVVTFAAGATLDGDALKLTNMDGVGIKAGTITADKTAFTTPLSVAGLIFQGMTVYRDNDGILHADQSQEE